jgi:hypothetical protein
MAGPSGTGGNEIPDIPYGGGGDTGNTGGTGTGGSGGGTGTGTGGNTTLSQQDVPGDLGQRTVTVLADVLIRKALRMNASQNVARLHVHRYRGHREAFKFNYYVQSVMQQAAYTYFMLRDRDKSLRTVELALGPASSSTATSSENAMIYHVRKQVEFREWMLSKDADIRWFVN